MFVNILDSPRPPALAEVSFPANQRRSPRAVAVYRYLSFLRFSPLRDFQTTHAQLARMEANACYLGGNIPVPAAFYCLPEGSESRADHRPRRLRQQPTRR